MLRNNLHFEKLEGNRKGTYSVRVKDGWRIIFRFEKDGLIVTLPKMVDFPVFQAK